VHVLGHAEELDGTAPPVRLEDPLEFDCGCVNVHQLLAFLVDVGLRLAVDPVGGGVPERVVEPDFQVLDCELPAHGTRLVEELVEGALPLFDARVLVLHEILLLQGRAQHFLVFEFCGAVGSLDVREEADRQFELLVVPAADVHILLSGLDVVRGAEQVHLYVLELRHVVVQQLELVPLLGQDVFGTVVDQLGLQAEVVLLDCGFELEQLEEVLLGVLVLALGHALEVGFKWSAENQL